MKTEDDCHVIVREDDEAVHVPVAVCWEDSEDHWNDRDHWDCGIHAHLE